MSAGPANALLIASALVSIALCAIALLGMKGSRERPFWRGLIALTSAPLALTLIAALAVHMAGLHYAVVLGPAFTPKDQALIDGWSSAAWLVGLATWLVPMALASLGLARSSSS